MKNNPFIKAIFSFSRSELRGIIVLFILITILILLRVKVKHAERGFDFTFIIDSKEYEQGTLIKDEFINSDEEANKKPASKKLITPVDPNTASYNELIGINLSSEVASNIIKYRLGGGQFNEANDLLKIYGMDNKTLMAINGRIKIKSKSHNSKPTLISKKIIKNIEINSADSAQLTTLPGIGPVLSRRIIKYRDLLGGFYSRNQIKEVYGISDSLFLNLEYILSVDTNNIQLININNCNLDKLKKHPYITNYQAKAVLSYRKLMGKFTSTSQLVDNYLLSEENYQKLMPYLSIN